MWLRLSIAFGIPLRELQARMGSAEFAEYLALWRLEPWGEARIDTAAATVAATVANHLGRRRRQLRDFLPAWLQPRARARGGDMLAVRDQFLAAYRAAARGVKR